MKIGYCLGSYTHETDPMGLRYLPLLAKHGYAYAELSLAGIAALSESEFEKLRQDLLAGGIPCETCNCFLPGSLRITGPDTDRSALQEYLAVALPRAEKLGVKVIVFGSAGAKNVPEGFSHETAFAQIVEALREVDGFITQNNLSMQIAIEPLNKKESNIILNLSDGLALVQAVDRNTIQLLVDYYHFEAEGDTLNTLREAGPNLIHVHVATRATRAVPYTIEPEMDAFFNTLKEIGYTSRISVEAIASNAEADIPAFAEAVKKHPFSTTADISPNTLATDCRTRI